MRNTSLSLFRQVLNLIPKREFEVIIIEHAGYKYKQLFDSLAHFESIFLSAPFDISLE